VKFLTQVDLRLKNAHLKKTNKKNYFQLRKKSRKLRRFQMSFFCAEYIITAKFAEIKGREKVKIPEKVQTSTFDPCIFY